MFIRTEKNLYDTEKCRYFEVFTAHNKYDSHDAHIGLVYGWLESEGCNDSVYIFSGTVSECQAMLNRIASAIVQGEIKIFTIKEDGTRRVLAQVEPV